MLEVEYKLPAKGDINRGTAFVADGMPFQVALSMMSENIAVDIYVDGADAYAPVNGKYDPRAWEVRYERYAFDDLDELGEYFLKEISERISQI